MNKQYTHYADFDSAYGFATRAGFQLTALQIQDVEKFLTLDRALNTYEVGGGKTVLATVVALMRGNSQKLVIVPPVLITPWVKWLIKVTDNVLLYRGDPRERKELSIKKAHWIVMSHAIFRIDYKRIAYEVSDDLEIIVDEAHNLKNASSVLFKKVNQLCLGL